MSAPSKIKGTKWATAIVKFLDSCGVKADRNAEHGRYDIGDIDVDPWPDVVIEAKNEKGYYLAQWIKEAEIERRNAKANIGVVWAHAVGKASPGDGYVIMTGQTFTDLMIARAQWIDQKSPPF